MKDVNLGSHQGIVNQKFFKIVASSRSWLATLLVVKHDRDCEVMGSQDRSIIIGFFF